MIGRLRGFLLAKNPPQIVVDVAGVGYEVDVPMSTFYLLPAITHEVSLLTHLAVREDGYFLYGFFTEAERFAFRQLLKISGIGARTALAVLSGLSVGELSDAVNQQDANRLIRVPGIGKKTAERLLLELKDKLSAFAQPTQITKATDESHRALGEIESALLALGYNARETRHTIEALPRDVTVDNGIRLALKQLAKL